MNFIVDQFAYHQDKPMLFHHGIFLFLLANLLILYALFSQKRIIQNWLIILFSAYFYYKASGAYFLLLFSTLCSDYLFSIAIFKSSRFKKIWTISGILFSLSFLLYFKYAQWIVESLGLNAASFNVSNLYLPIGISFYTFQSISYLVDTYRGKIELPKFQSYLLYMTFFPHLVAGPIVRAKDFLPQLKKKLSITQNMVNEGLYLISKGLIKKAIIADFIAQYVDIIYAAPQGANGLESLMATLAYTLQIFCDFSGYTDMAIGIALLVGYRLCTNFESPYASTSITEFWRKWHISLSSWLRDFIYIPLGGNRKGPYLQLLFLMITMTVGGIWHGADWKFMWWGIGHGCLLIIHKIYLKYFPNWNHFIWNKFSWFLTFACVSLLWIPFRALNEQDSWIIFQNIFTKMSFHGFSAMFAQNSLLLTLIILGFAATLMNENVKSRIKHWYFKEHFLVKMALLLIIIQLMYQVQSETVQPFIYFQF